MDGCGELICLAVYKRGAYEVVRRLMLAEKLPAGVCKNHVKPLSAKSTLHLRHRRV